MNLFPSHYKFWEILQVDSWEADEVAFTPARCCWSSHICKNVYTDPSWMLERPYKFLNYLSQQHPVFVLGCVVLEAKKCSDTSLSTIGLKPALSRYLFFCQKMFANVFSRKFVFKKFWGRYFCSLQVAVISITIFVTEFSVKSYTNSFSSVALIRF